MPVPVDAIVNSLAPGIALTSGIFFANGLQNRYSLVTTRVRALNTEAREQGEKNPDRLESLRWQVTLLTRRARVMHKAILVTYLGLLAYLATMVLLLGSSFFRLNLTFFTYGIFAFGLGCIGSSMFMALSELRLSHDTLEEDVRSSFEQKPRS